jgi:hypothetical protein
MRHRQRHLHKTIVEYLRGVLDDDGWITAPVNFSTTPVTLMEYEPQQAGETPPFNAVSVSIGDQGEDTDQELGGGLTRIEYVLFVDIYGESESIGIAIAEDVKAALTNRLIPLRDYTSDAAGAETDDQIEFERVLVETIPTATSTLDKRSWRVVKATACCYF